MLKKVLIAYFPRPPIIDYMKRAFEKKGIEVVGFHSDVNNWFDRYVIHYANKTAHNLRLLPKSRVLFQDHPLSHLKWRSERLLQKVREVRPDLVFIVRGWRFTGEALREIRKTSTVFGWWIEREERMEEPFLEIRKDLFDHYFFINSSSIDEGRRRGFEDISLLHHSVDTSAFYPMDVEKRYDWCFVGGWTPKRLAFVERAFGVSGNGVVYGSKWIKKNPFHFSLRKAVRGRYIGGRDLVRLYNETRVVLNITSWGLGEGEGRSGMNMRVLEVPACKCCLLTDGSRDMKSVVTPGEHLVLYEGLDDFAEKLRGLIDNRAERERVASHGYSHVLGNYTYDDLVDTVIDTYGKKQRRAAEKAWT